MFALPSEDVLPHALGLVGVPEAGQVAVVVLPVLTADDSPVFDGALVVDGIDQADVAANIGKIGPFVLIQGCSLIDFESAIPHPCVQHPAIGPFAFFCRYVDAVVLGGLGSVAHAAAETKVLQRSAAQLSIEVVLVVPTESTILKTHVDKSVACPAGKMRPVDA